MMSIRNALFPALLSFMVSEFAVASDAIRTLDVGFNRVPLAKLPGIPVQWREYGNTGWRKVKWKFTSFELEDIQLKTYLRVLELYPILKNVPEKRFAEIFHLQIYTEYHLGVSEARDVFYPVLYPTSKFGVMPKNIFTRPYGFASDTGRPTLNEEPTFFENSLVRGIDEADRTSFKLGDEGQKYLSVFGGNWSERNLSEVFLNQIRTVISKMQFQISQEELVHRLVDSYPDLKIYLRSHPGPGVLTGNLRGDTQRELAEAEIEFQKVIARHESVVREKEAQAATLSTRIQELQKLSAEVEKANAAAAQDRNALKNELAALRINFEQALPGRAMPAQLSEVTSFIQKAVADSEQLIRDLDAQRATHEATLKDLRGQVADQDGLLEKTRTEHARLQSEATRFEKLLTQFPAEPMQGVLYTVGKIEGLGNDYYWKEQFSNFLKLQMESAKVRMKPLVAELGLKVALDVEFVRFDYKSSWFGSGSKYDTSAIVKAVLRTASDQAATVSSPIEIRITHVGGSPPKFEPRASDLAAFQNELVATADRLATLEQNSPQRVFIAGYRATGSMEKLRKLANSCAIDLEVQK